MNGAMQGMGIYGVIGILGIILGLAKEILIVILLFQGIRIANIFIKNNKDGGNPLKKEENIPKDTVDNKEDQDNTEG